MDDGATVPSLPRLNEPVPDFEAVTTHGPMRLSDLTNAGKWVLLFSHPADFTPVCTTEFVAFSELAPEFERRNAQLLGLSVGALTSHLAWIHDIERNLGVKVPFPVIADLDMKVSRLYGMIHPGASATAAVRAVFLIDPKRVLRAMVYYPLTTGRWMPEFLRLLDALQTTDQYGVSTPANWEPGKEVVVPAPTTAQALAAEEAKKGEYDYKSWYLRLKKL
ncbi:MAG: peroxiredoxin [Sphaerobacter sp.]|nr:peroxiredoxin [Sphaerobacter sp.]